MHNKVPLTAIHLPGEENVTADALSKGVDPPHRVDAASSGCAAVVPTDRPPTRRYVCFKEQPPTPDVQLEGSRPECMAEGRSGCPVGWASSVYFPPISLLARVITKLEQEECIIAPFWPSHLWFTRLTRLLVHRPVVLPQRADILFQPSSGLLHPAPQHLHLTC